MTLLHLPLWSKKQKQHYNEILTPGLLAWAFAHFGIFRKVTDPVGENLVRGFKWLSLIHIFYANLYNAQFESAEEAS